MTIWPDRDAARIAYDDESELDDEYLFDSDDEDDEDYRPPEWLHADCLSVCFALDVGTCCKYPDNPLVECAGDLADLVDLALRRVEGSGCEGSGCAGLAAELAYRLKLIPGLLAQIHAIAPRLNSTAVTQLLCPIGRLANAVDQVSADGCPWACADPAIPDRRAEFAQLRPLLTDCLLVLRTSLGWTLPPR